MFHVYLAARRVYDNGGLSHCLLHACRRCALRQEREMERVLILQRPKLQVCDFDKHKLATARKERPYVRELLGLSPTLAK